VDSTDLSCELMSAFKLNSVIGLWAFWVR